jgi:pyrroline-5-carboxylate reductase
MTDKIRLLLVGCGKMGGALLRQALSACLLIDSVVIDPSPVPDFVQPYPYVRWTNVREAVDDKFKPDIVLFAVKPQQMADSAAHYAHYTSSVFVSIAAGITLSGLQKIIGNKNAAIIRTMPNLPASVGAGMTVAITNAAVSSAHKQIAETLLRSFGDLVWFDNEELIDAATALSGSGPAYLFALCEVMAKSGEALGLDADLASRLARQTIIGSGLLLASDTQSAETLRRNVTSPGGTTEAALKIILGTNGLQELMTAGMRASVRRAGELSKL